ncbi:MAG: translesion DNA synthesis-associated protein ImuA [Porticoccaceae bacterium]|nr:translesion DNA synthesis-associated protein ImuA [Porticoccaceae bacterium]
MNKKLSALLSRPDIWQGSALPQQSHSISTGYPTLDKSLHQGGWPVGAITELLSDNNGIGELQVVLPVLTQYARQTRKLVFVSPPYIPYAPALFNNDIALEQIIVIKTLSTTEQLWALEQLLRADIAGAVLCWLTDKAVDHRQLRKLQLTAQASRGIAVLFRPTQTAAEASPAALRIALSPTVPSTVPPILPPSLSPIWSPTSVASSVTQACRLHILKQRGGWAGQVLDIPRPRHLLETTIAASSLPVHRPARQSTQQSAGKYADIQEDFSAYFSDQPFDTAPDTLLPEADYILH